MKLLKSRETIYSFLLFFVIFTAIIGYKLNSISIILVSVFYLFDKDLPRKIKSISSKIPYFFLVYFIFHLVGYLYSENKLVATHEIEVKLSFLILPIIIFSEKISKQNIYKIFVWFKYWAICFAVFLMLHKLIVIEGPISSLSTHSLFFLTGIHQAYFSLFYVFCLFFVFHQIRANQIKIYLGFVEIAFFLFFISVLEARVIVFFTGIITLVFFIQQFIKVKGIKRILIFTSFFLFGLLVYKETNITKKFSRLSKVEWNINKNIYNHQVFSFDYDDKTSNTLELRLVKWYCAYQIFKEAPILGFGSGDYSDKLVEQYHKIDFKKGMVYKYNTHNQYLEEFLKFGIIGGMFFLFFIGYVFFDAIYRRNNLLIYTMLIMCFFLFVESAFERQHAIVFFAFFIPILYIFNNNKKIV